MYKSGLGAHAKAKVSHSMLQANSADYNMVSLIFFFFFPEKSCNFMQIVS